VCGYFERKKLSSDTTRQHTQDLQPTVLAGTLISVNLTPLHIVRLNLSSKQTGHSGRHMLLLGEKEKDGKEESETEKVRKNSFSFYFKTYENTLLRHTMSRPL
jgi:hypothetical protein